MPREHWMTINNLFVGFGQLVCTPTHPKCAVHAPLLLFITEVMSRHCGGADWRATQRSDVRSTRCAPPDGPTCRLARLPTSVDDVCFVGQNVWSDCLGERSEELGGLLLGRLLPLGQLGPLGLRAAHHRRKLGVGQVHLDHDDYTNTRTISNVRYGLQTTTGLSAYLELCEIEVVDVHARLEVSVRTHDAGTST